MVAPGGLVTRPTLTHRLANGDDLDAVRSLMEAAISELQEPLLDERRIASSRAIMGLDIGFVEAER